MVKGSRFSSLKELCLIKDMFVDCFGVKCIISGFDCYGMRNGKHSKN